MSELSPNLLDDDVPPPADNKPRGKAAAKKTANKFRVILEENEQIPPTGQFLSVNGKGIVIKPGEEVIIGEEYLHVLENAIASAPIMGDDNRVIGYRNRSRLPFRNLGPA